MSSPAPLLRVVAKSEADQGLARHLWWWRGTQAPADASPEQALPPPCAALQGLGWRTDAAPACHNLVHLDIPQHRYGLLWCPDAQALTDWLATARPGAHLPMGCLLISPPPQGSQIQALQAQGVAAWLPLESTAETIAAALLWARGPAQQLRQAQMHLDERKWTERAKGLLMQAREIDEAAAFKILRDAAMQTHVRLGSVARAVIDTSELAELLERAGAQRMLSQRLVKLHALRMTQVLASGEQREAKALQSASMERVQANLARLTQLLQGRHAALLAAVERSWSELQRLLNLRSSLSQLALMDDAAQGLLEASEALVEALLQGAAERPVRLVTQAARLRLLSQGLAKEGLLAQLLPGRDPGRLAQGLDAFVAAYQPLRHAPLHSPGLQQAFEAVDEAWALLLRGLREESGAAATRALHQGSERLLAAVEALTQTLQRSLQIILG
jgi:hypothetical protein